jgi:hypothetical protein
VASKHSGRLVVPPRVGKGPDGKVTKAEDLFRFVERVTDYESSRRHELCVAVQLNNLSLMNIGWVKIERQRDGWTGTRRTPRVIRETRDDIPQPNRPLALKLHENEVARTSKRFSEINVQPKDAANPTSRAAAKVSNNVLKDHLENQKWPYKHRDFWDQDYRHGWTVLKSSNLWDHQDTTAYPVLTAAKCIGKRGVEIKQRPVVNPLDGMPAVDPLTQAPLMEDYEEPYESPSCESWVAEYKGQPCPCCQGDMKSTTPTFEEAKSSKDYHGKRLGKDQPKAKPQIDVCHVLGYFPENEGEGIPIHELKTHAEIYVRSMAWVERYFPKVAEQITAPASAEDIAEIFPTCEYDSTSKGSKGVGDRNVWNNHVICREYNDENKSKAFPMGRSILIISTQSGNYAAVDDDYWVKGEAGQSEIARVEYGVARCFPRDRDVMGDGFPTMSRSAEKLINITTSQMADRREHSLFGIMASKGMKLFRELKNTLAGMIWRYEADPLFPGSKPDMVQMNLSDTSGLNEIKYHEEAIHGDLGQNDADLGNLKGVTDVPYSMYALSKESTSERREPRLKEGLDAIRRVLKHQLVLLNRYVREPREYRVKAADGWEVKEYLGTDLQNETDVQIKEEPFFDQKNAVRDATAKAVTDGQLQLATKRAQREYFKALGVEPAILEESNVQLEKVERNFMVWYRTQKTPIINPTQDDLDLCYQEYGRLVMSDEGVERAEMANWDEVVDTYVGWEEELAALQAAIPGLKKLGWQSGQPIIQQQEQPVTDPMTGEPVLDPMTGQPAMQMGTVNLLDQAAQAEYGEQLQQIQTMDQQAAMAAQSAQLMGQPTAAPQPTQPPPPPEPSKVQNPEPLKAGLQWLINFTWRDMCMRAGVDVSEKNRTAFMEIQSVVEAYRLLSAAKTGVMPVEPGAPSADPGQPMAA